MAGRCRSCCRRSSPAITVSGCPRPRRIAGLSAGWPSRIALPPRRPGGGVGRVRHPHPGGCAGPVRAWGGAVWSRIGSLSRPPGPLTELARSQHTTVNIVLQGAFAQLLMSLTGQHDVVFGTAVSGRPAELAGAESMVGLLINTVPVRATLTAATTAAELLEQLQRNHNHTLEHQHLALPRDAPRSPARTSCSTPCSSTRTTQSTPPHCQAITTWPSPSSPPRIQPLPADGGGRAWDELNLTSNTTPMCSMRPASRR